jgi:hypothetical protein
MRFPQRCVLSGALCLSCNLANCTRADVPAPDLRVAHLESLNEARAVLAVDNWAVQYSKKGIEIAVHALPSSNFHLIKSSVVVPLSVERTHAHYTVRGQAAHACMPCAFSDIGARSTRRTGRASPLKRRSLRLSKALCMCGTTCR